MEKNYYYYKQRSKKIFKILGILIVIAFVFLILLYMTSCALPPAVTKANEDSQIKTKVLPSIPNNPTPLPKVLNLSWKLNPDLPRGIQDPAIGKIGGAIIYIAGFCQGLNNDMKPGKYPRGFFKEVWAFDGTNYIQLPDFPGDARQALMPITINNEIYVWGGFSYSAPYTYQDGWKLSYSNGNWIWTKLPDLPYPLVYAGYTHIGSKIYLFGGMQYNITYHDDFSTESTGNNLLMIDTNNLSAGWTIIQNCPLTKRGQLNFTAIGNDLYVVGGAYFENLGISGKCYNVVDNWKYDTVNNTWTRLVDMPISCTGFATNSMLFHGRYIILVGGYQYPEYLGFDGHPHEKYGVPSQFVGGTYFNDIYVYDTMTNSFSRTDYEPINNSLLSATVIDNQLYIIGGEADPCYIDGIFFGHHPDLNLVGIISE